MNKRTVLQSAFALLSSASPDALQESKEATPFQRVKLDIQKSQRFELVWMVPSRSGFVNSWIPVFRLGVEACDDRDLAPNGFRVWWWHGKAHPLPGYAEWNSQSEFRDHLSLDGDHYLMRFRIMASVMEKLPELKRLLEG